MIRAAWLLLGFVAVAEPSPGRDPRATAEWWVEAYGQLPATAARVRRAQGLLDRLWRAAGQRLGLPPRLVVLARPRPDLVALALPDNSIVVSRNGLDFCLETATGTEAPAELGDARLGLVLAHELDHVLSDDDWHVAAFEGQEAALGILRGRATGGEVRYAAELRADGNALLLLVAAGIDPAPALRPVSFFESWARTRGAAAAPSATHPAVEPRTLLLRRELERLAAHLRAFKRGVADLQAGHSQAALQAFDEFHRATRYSGKELLNDIGLAHYQLAFSALARCDATAARRFRFGTWVDAGDQVERRLRGAGPFECLAPGSAASLQLGAAIERLRAAADADPAYLPARLNLVSALSLAGRTAEAYAQARELDEGRAAGRLAPLPEGDGRRALVRSAVLVSAYLVRQELAAPGGDATGGFEALAAAFPADPTVAYNRARILQEVARVEEAREAWATFLRLEPKGPWARAALLALAALGPAEDGPGGGPVQNPAPDSLSQPPERPSPDRGGERI